MDKNLQFIVALGNPGQKYSTTRHNAGFLAADFIARSPEFDIIATQEKFHAKIVQIKHKGDAAENFFFLVYPQTFMNDSGSAVRELLQFYKQDPQSILVLHDDIDLPLGTIRFTDGSRDAGHNGVKSLIENLATQNFRRIRIGIENRSPENKILTSDFVLQNFSDEELKLLPYEQIKNRVLLELRPKI